MDPESQVRAVPRWWHSIEVAPGVTTPGIKTPRILKQELARLQLPSLTGKTVLDIGAWDGFYSFHAERAGARTVSALDHFSWQADLAGYLNSPDYDESIDVSTTRFWRPEELPGKVGFDTAHRLLGSRVQTIVGDFMTMDLDLVGKHDIVLYLGILYHMDNPLGALRRLRQVTGDVAIIETEAFEVLGYSSQSLCEFIPDSSLNGDPTNWWVFNLTALLAMIRAAGFRRVEVRSGRRWGWPLRCLYRRFRSKKPGEWKDRYRLVVHAFP
jgi:tRNA (mo5U34)-methyltransferase